MAKAPLKKVPFFLFSSDDDENGRDPVYTEDGEYESITSSEDEKGTFCA